MANFEVVISEMNSTSADFKKFSENFRETGNAVVQAAHQMNDTGWKDDAVVVFMDKVNQLNNWIKSMSEILDQYGRTLNEAGQTYREADVAAAKNFN